MPEFIRNNVSSVIAQMRKSVSALFEYECFMKELDESIREEFALNLDIILDGINLLDSGVCNEIRRSASLIKQLKLRISSILDREKRNEKLVEGLFMNYTHRTKKEEKRLIEQLQDDYFRYKREADKYGIVPEELEFGKVIKNAYFARDPEFEQRLLKLGKDPSDLDLLKYKPSDKGKTLDDLPEIRSSTDMTKRAAFKLSNTPTQSSPRESSVKSPLKSRSINSQRKLRTQPKSPSRTPSRTKSRTPSGTPSKSLSRSTPTALSPLKSPISEIICRPKRSMELSKLSIEKSKPHEFLSPLVNQNSEDFISDQNDVLESEEFETPTPLVSATTPPDNNVQSSLGKIIKNVSIGLSKKKKSQVIIDHVSEGSPCDDKQLVTSDLDEITIPPETKARNATLKSSSLKLNHKEAPAVHQNFPKRKAVRSKQSKRHRKAKSKPKKALSSSLREILDSIPTANFQPKNSIGQWADSTGVLSELDTLSAKSSKKKRKEKEKAPSLLSPPSKPQVSMIDKRNRSHHKIVVPLPELPGNGTLPEPDELMDDIHLDVVESNNVPKKEYDGFSNDWINEKETSKKPKNGKIPDLLGRTIAPLPNIVSLSPKFL